MYDVKIKPAMDRPKLRPRSAFPKEMTFLLRQQYAQQKQTRRPQEQQASYATEQTETAAKVVGVRMIQSAKRVRERQLWQKSAEPVAGAQQTAETGTRPFAKTKQPQNRAKHHVQEKLWQEIKILPQKVAQRLGQVMHTAVKTAKSALLPLFASGGAVLALLLMIPVLAMVLVLSPAAILTNTEATEPEQKAMELWAALPDDLPMERRMVVTYALSLVGKVDYFWGGKSRALGWDERWGEPTEVTAPEDETTGTVRPFGLDCSGFVDWVFYNATGGEINLSGGDGVVGQHAACTEIPWTEAQPGDLVFYLEDEHVGIVCGRDRLGGLLVVHCAAGRGYVSITGKNGFCTAGLYIAWNRGFTAARHVDADAQ